MNKGSRWIERTTFRHAVDDIDVLFSSEKRHTLDVETIDGSLYALLGVLRQALPILGALSLSGKAAESLRPPATGELGS
jgi:hypothetical protein